MIFAQAAWAIIILMAAWFCFEGARHDRTPMRILAFVAIFIGVLHGAAELHRLVQLLEGRPVDQKIGIEVFLPIVMAVSKYFPLVKHADRPG